MSGLHATAEFLTGRVNILQRHLAKGFQPALSPATKVKCSIVEELRAIKCMFHRTLIRKQYWRGRDDLQVNSITVHFPEPNLRIPTRRINMTEESISHHNVGLPRLGVLDPRPVRRAIACRQVRP